MKAAPPGRELRYHRWTVHVKRHALERFQIHHPDAVIGDVMLAVNTGIPMARELAIQFLGREMGRQGPVERYVLAPDRWGLFVVTLERPPVLITYLRFGLSQHSVALRLWPLPPRVNAVPKDPPAVRVPDAPPLASVQAAATVSQNASPAPTAIKKQGRDKDSAKIAVFGENVFALQVGADVARPFGTSTALRWALIDNTPFERIDHDRGEPELIYRLKTCCGEWVGVRIHRQRGRLTASIDGPLPAPEMPTEAPEAFTNPSEAVAAPANRDATATTPPILHDVPSK